MRLLLRVAKSVFIPGLLLMVVGCGTAPTFVTRHQSPEVVREPIKELRLIIVQGRFPESATGKGIGDLPWYESVGERMRQNFAHNGINVASISVVGGEGASPLSSSMPTLVIDTKELTLLNSIPSTFLFDARLWIPNRSGPIWSGLGHVRIFQAGDELSLQLINELGKLKLLAPIRSPAETLDGKKHYMVGGVLY